MHFYYFPSINKCASIVKPFEAGKREILVIAKVIEVMFPNQSAVIDKIYCIDRNLIGKFLGKFLKYFEIF